MDGLILKNVYTSYGSNSPSEYVVNTLLKDSLLHLKPTANLHCSVSYEALCHCSDT